MLYTRYEYPVMGRRSLPKEENLNEIQADISFSLFQIDCLNAHNIYRSQHGVPDLILCKELCDYALDWANVNNNIYTKKPYFP